MSKQEARVLVTTLTKKMAEDLTDYLLESGIRVRYLHADIDTVERIEILRDLRLGEFDVLVGINLLREGLDLPEVSLVAILDADKEGYLRSQTSSDPDDRTCGQERRGPGDHVRRRGDGFDAACDHRDPASPADPDGIQRGTRHRPDVASGRRSATSSSRGSDARGDRRFRPSPRAAGASRSAGAPMS